MKQLGSTDLKRLHRTWRKNANNKLALILDGVAQPFNVGAIVRTAAAYRVSDLWLVGQTPGPDNTKVARTALGSERFIDVHRSDDATLALSQARSKGYHVVGLELADGAVPIHHLGDIADIALVIGHEDRGLRPDVLDACDMVAFLPQLGKIGSLNVATATSIALYELRRREWIGDASSLTSWTK